MVGSGDSDRTLAALVADGWHVIAVRADARPGRRRIDARSPGGQAMIAVARYLLADYVRSLRFVAPALVLVAGVVVFYAQPPNPVLSTAGSVVGLLFAAHCWLALGFFNSQGTPDRHVLSATAGGRTFVCARMLAAGALALGASIFAIAYPLLAGRFDRGPSLGELALILLANMTATVGATALAALFARPLIYNRATSVLGLTLCVVLTIPLRLPGSAVPVAQALDTNHAAQVPARLSADLGSILIFTAAVGVVCARQWRRRD